MSTTADQSPLPDVAAIAISDKFKPSMPEEEKKKKRKRWTAPAVASSSSSSEKLEFPCTVCSRSFDRSKALFGHMRSHPERQWRGVNPPQRGSRQLTQDQEQSRRDDEEVLQALNLLSAARSMAAPQVKYVCKGCNLSFPSYQSLGGHRATHKGVKGCFANSSERNEIKLLDSDLLKQYEERKARSQRVAERLKMELDNHRPSNLKFYNFLSDGKRDLQPPFDLSLDPTPSENLDLELRLGY